jgi:hypothetical protein
VAELHRVHADRLLDGCGHSARGDDHVPELSVGDVPAATAMRTRNDERVPERPVGGRETLRRAHREGRRAPQAPAAMRQKTHAESPPVTRSVDRRGA